jgi:hypothetical protein
MLTTDAKKTSTIRDVFPCAYVTGYISNKFAALVILKMGVARIFETLVQETFFNLLFFCVCIIIIPWL